MIRRKKGQVALEFLLFSAIFLLTFLVVLVVINLYGNQDRTGTNFLLANELANRLSSQFVVAYGLGEGFNYTLSFPPTLGGSSYEVIIVNDTQSTLFVRVSLSGSLLGERNENLAVVTLPFEVDCPLSMKNFGVSGTECRLEPASDYYVSVKQATQGASPFLNFEKAPSNLGGVSGG